MYNPTAITVIMIAIISLIVSRIIFFYFLSSFFCLLFLIHKNKYAILKKCHKNCAIRIGINNMITIIAGINAAMSLKVVKIIVFIFIDLTPRTGLAVFLFALPLFWRECRQRFSQAPLTFFFIRFLVFLLW